MALSKQDTKDLIASSLYSFYDQILKDKFIEPVADSEIDTMLQEVLGDVQDGSQSPITTPQVATDQEINNMLLEVLGGDYSGK